MATERTPKQIEASRINGARSRGPVTEEGKAVSARNNTRHGLLSNTILISGESAEEFNRLLASLILEFEPETESELLMIEEMVVMKWRQIRAWCMIAGAHTQAIDAQPETAPDIALRPLPTRAFNAIGELNGKNSVMDTLHRYDARFSRQYQRLLQMVIRSKERRREL